VPARDEGLIDHEDWRHAIEAFDRPEKPRVVVDA